MSRTGPVIVSLSLAAGMLLAAAGQAAAAEDPVVQHNAQASYYHDKHQGRRTATGQRFDQRKPTAASNSLPLGSRATVTNTQNGKSVDVEITDRMRGRRSIDLSKEAASRIDLDRRQGKTPVTVEARAADQPTEQLKSAVERQAAGTQNRRR